MVTIIIPAAGLAKRMRPLSSNTSKAMVSLNGKPIIHYILQSIDSMFTNTESYEVIIVENKFKDIQEFVNVSHSEKDIKFVEQVDPKGPLHAIAVGAEVMSEESHSTLVWLGDTIVLNPDFKFDCNFLGVAPVTDQERWCMVDKDINFFDKPESSDDIGTDLALVGIYGFEYSGDFKEMLKLAMEEPLIKDEHQISSLLNKYTSTYNMGEFQLHDLQEDWYDCGELNTFYDSKARLINRSDNSRDFNNMSVDTLLNVITKSSNSLGSQIENEKNWYKQLSERQSLFVPRCLNSKLGEVTLSWESGSTLSEMFLFEKISNDNWKVIIDKLFVIMTEIFHEPIVKTDVDVSDAFNMYITNSTKRFKQIQFQEDRELVNQFILNTGSAAIAFSTPSKCIHGDLHFGNILFESFNGSIKLIDPRGKFGDSIGIIGDRNYDYAKLLHDWIGGYIFINSGIDLDETHPKTEEFKFIQEYMIEKLKERLTSSELINVIKLSIFLCITCIPLHSDNIKKQKQLWDNAVKQIKDEVWLQYV